MTEKQQPNPLARRAFDQSGAAAVRGRDFWRDRRSHHRKLVPALYNIAADGELPPAVAVVGFARRPKTR